MEEPSLSSTQRGGSDVAPSLNMTSESAQRRYRKAAMADGSRMNNRTGERGSPENSRSRTVDRAVGQTEQARLLATESLQKQNELASFQVKIDKRAQFKYHGPQPHKSPNKGQTQINQDLDNLGDNTRRQWPYSQQRQRFNQGLLLKPIGKKNVHPADN